MSPSSRQSAPEAVQPDRRTAVQALTREHTDQRALTDAMNWLLEGRSQGRPEEPLCLHWRCASPMGARIPPGRSTPQVGGEVAPYVRGSVTGRLHTRPLILVGPGARGCVVAAPPVTELTVKKDSGYQSTGTADAVGAKATAARKGTHRNSLQVEYFS